MKKNIFLFFSANLISNFKPSLYNLNSNSTLRKQQQNNQIYCKNFLLYLLLLKNKNNFFLKSEIFIKKFKKKVYTILKSPYRYKIARHQLSLNRYNINFSTKIKIKKSINILKWGEIISLFNFLKSFQKIFESNIVFINSLKFNIPCKYKNNFIITNFQKIK